MSRVHNRLDPVRGAARMIKRVAGTDGQETAGQKSALGTSRWGSVKRVFTRLRSSGFTLYAPPS